MPTSACISFMNFWEPKNNYSLIQVVLKKLKDFRDDNFDWMACEMTNETLNISKEWNQHASKHISGLVQPDRNFRQGLFTWDIHLIKTEAVKNGHQLNLNKSNGWAHYILSDISKLVKRRHQIPQLDTSVKPGVDGGSRAELRSAISLFWQFVTKAFIFY